MAIYKFRATYEDDNDLIRDIEIKSESTFLQLHNTLVQAFEFTNNELASFYVSDDTWRKGKEISLEDMSDEGDDPLTKAVLMRKSILADFIEDPHQKFIYVFDFMNQWAFMVELVKIGKEDAKVKYPVIVKKEGDIPKAFKNIAPTQIGDDEIEDDDPDWNDGQSKRKFNDDFEDDHFEEDEFDGDFGHEDDEQGGSQGTYEEM